jgi:uncharacterized protein (UPF0210 family)
MIEQGKLLTSERFHLASVCCDADLDILNEKIHAKIIWVAKDLVTTGKTIDLEFGILINNKHISVTPIALVGGQACRSLEDFVTIAKTLDQVVRDTGVNFLGGYSALVPKGMTLTDEDLIRSILQAPTQTKRVCGSMNSGSTKTSINMDAVKLIGEEFILGTAEATFDSKSFCCAKLVIFCNVLDDNPFMAGIFHGVTEADVVVNVGVSGPDVIKHVLESGRGKKFEVLCKTVKKTACKVTRVGQPVTQEVSERFCVPFGIGGSLVRPNPANGDGVAEIFEEMDLESIGATDTTTALALLSD